MNKTNSSQGYDADYKILQLKQAADWSSARANYRKLVNKWHPDKYSNRPRELDHAQKQFIALSKSYNRLKGFHTLHDRLPFENNPPKEIRPDAQVNAPPVSETIKSNVDPNNLDLGHLGRDETKVDARLIKKSPMAKILWGSTACILIVGTIMLFLILDRRANQQNVAAGRQAIKEAPESEFTPTPSELRNGRSKGVFISGPD